MTFIVEEVTAKERAMICSRSTIGLAVLKRKRESEEETNLNKYFFAKFLTDPLDLEASFTSCHWLGLTALSI